MAMEEEKDQTQLPSSQAYTIIAKKYFYFNKTIDNWKIRQKVDASNSTVKKLTENELVEIQRFLPPQLEFRLHSKKFDGDCTAYAFDQIFGAQKTPFTPEELQNVI